MPSHLQTTLEALRAEARALTSEVKDPAGVEWLSGRISGLTAALAVANGDRSDGSTATSSTSTR